MTVKSGALVMLAIAVLLSACARVPEALFSKDGGKISAIASQSFHYTPAGGAEVRCWLKPGGKTYVCDNGIESPMLAAGLPFEGLVLMEFDGKHFMRPRRN